MPSTSSWRVRPARPDDRDFVIGLAPRLTDGFPLPPWRTPEEVARTEAATLDLALTVLPHGNALLIAESADGKPAGLVYLERLFDYYRRPHGHVGILAVAAETEGQGVGRVLLEAAEDWAREQKLHMLSLNVFAGNERARRVYERLGYMPETLRYVKPL
jgi:GNAT superfamily N-acetyltransferase